jgi:hypothetical protein
VAGQAQVMMVAQTQRAYKACVCGFDNAMCCLLLLQSWCWPMTGDFDARHRWGLRARATPAVCMLLLMRLQQLPV